jgi:hypothetical protein
VFFPTEGLELPRFAPKLDGCWTLCDCCVSLVGGPYWGHAHQNHQTKTETQQKWLPYVAMIWCWQFLYFSDWVVPGTVGFRGIRGCFSLQTEVLMAQDFAVHRSPGKTEEQRRWVAAFYSEVNARPRTSQVSMTCWDNSSFSDCGFLWFFHGFSCLSLFKHQHCLIPGSPDTHHTIDTPRLYVPQVISSR